MSPSEAHTESARLEKKECWHLYSLQMLSTEKFIAITNKIMKGSLRLLSTRQIDLYRYEEPIGGSDN